MANKVEDISARAAESTLALNPLMGGLNRTEMIGAVALMLRRSMIAPRANLKLAGKIAREGTAIALGRSERTPERRDRRFKDAAWEHNPFYRRTVQAYMALQEGMMDWIDDLKLGELEHARARFVMGMILDAAAPTNTLIGNPQAQKRIIESGGLSLINGLKNAYDDLTHNGAMPAQVDKRPFKVGENLATTPGAVVWRTDMLELIQYTPATEEVHRMPLLIIPPQINKYYVNDLSERTSIVRFLLDQGIQVFCISWRNPTKEHRDWGLSDYVDQLVQVCEVVSKITRSKKLNISGACSGGITAATLNSLLSAAGDTRVNSSTYMVSVLNPKSDDSDIGKIASDRSLEIARKMSQRKGVLKGDDLARIFAWMRPNDLVWNYVVNNYLLGQDPPPFDVLYWNNDTTNLPAQLHSDYLDFGLQDPFGNPGEVELAGHLADLTKVKHDVFILAGVTDHITPWKACFRTIGLLGSENIEFVLSSSGHIQSLLNPPGNPKAKYFVNSDVKASPEDWAAGAEEVPGSWWPRWAEWLKTRSGAEKAAPKSLGNTAFKPVCDAPGEYVFG